MNLSRYDLKMFERHTAILIHNPTVQVPDVEDTTAWATAMAKIHNELGLMLRLVIVKIREAV